MGGCHPPTVNIIQILKIVKKDYFCMFESTTYFNNDRLKVLFSDIDFQKCVEDIERDFSKEY